MTFQPYNIVPGTDILHSITDCYEYVDEAEGVTHTAKLQADNGGVYIEYTEKKIDETTRGITEFVSIGSKDIAIVVARRILELYGELK